MAKKSKREKAEKSGEGGRQPTFDSHGDPAAFADFKRELRKINPQPLRESSSEEEDEFMPKIPKSRSHPPAAEASENGGKRKRGKKEGGSG